MPNNERKIDKIRKSLKENNEHNKIFKLMWRLYSGNKVMHAVILAVMGDPSAFYNGIWCNIVFSAKLVLKKLHLMKADPIIASLEGRYKDRHRRAFVIATGPSLRTEDLDLLERYEEITISMNSIYNIFDQTRWRPTYYIRIDSNGIDRQNREEAFVETISKREAVVSNACAGKMEWNGREGKVGVVDVYSFDHYLVQEFNPRFKYSTNWKTEGHYDMYTVAIAAINLADYMGIEEVFLLGADCDYSGECVYVGEKGNSYSQESASFSERTLIGGYQALAGFLEKRNIKVFNATRGGRLEVFERVNFDALWGGMTEERNMHSSR